MTVPQNPAPDRREHAQRMLEARKHVGALKGFYIHAAAFVGVVLLLAIIDIATGSPFWVHWVALGWGLALLAHRLLLDGGLARAVRRWEQRQIDAYMKGDGKP